MNQTTEYLLSALLVISLILLFSWWSHRKRMDIWTGVLQKKKSVAGDEDSQDQYILIFRTITGKKKKFTTNNREVWNQWTEGDKAQKKQGTYFPEKV